MSGPKLDTFLADFGLAKAVATGSKLTRTGEALGTPAYMSPEQARGEVSSLTPATDVWSLGVVLYETLAGRRPFESETDAAVVGRILLEEPARLRRIRGDLPEAVERVARVCLSKRGRHRYRNAVLLRDDLDRALRGVRIQARAPGSRQPAVLVAGLVAAAAAALVGLRPRATESPPAARAMAPTRGEGLAHQALAARHDDPRRAAQRLAEALREDPTREDWRLQRGLLLWAVGENAAARSEWEGVVAGSAESLTARTYLALEAWSRSEQGKLRWDQAAPIFAELKDLPDWHGRIARAALAGSRGDWRTAREELRDEPRWEGSLVRALIESSDPAGDPRERIRACSRTLEGGLPLAWAHAKRAKAHADIGEEAEALRDYDKVLSLVPGDPKTLCNRSVRWLKLGDRQRALADAEAALRGLPGEPEVLRLRGQVFHELDRLDEAVADYTAALRVRPADTVALCNRASARSGQGDLAGALQDADAAVRLDPSLADAWGTRGAIRLALGETPEALEDLDTAIRLRPDSARFLSNRGGAHVRLGNYPAAAQDLRSAVLIEPGFPDAHYNLGVALVALGQRAAARVEFARCIEIDPRNRNVANARVWISELETSEADPAGGK
ncbi:MAG: tetratricopeptide repeat protein [Planctomycetales bacterium]|nr:tetratricopeptide repeat protein [Planctomycetales bacterium]